MKYPTTILKGDGSRGKCISIATAKSGVIQDSGAKMIHIGANTNSYILSKSIAGGGGRANYRGNVSISKSAINSYSEVSCDSIILDSKSSSDTYPTEFINNNSSFIKHEAKITNLDKEKMYYINSRGIDANQAQHLLIMGFIAPFTDALPLEYAVELNHLLHKYF
jgi:Fe-S cluster assembly protein SufB